MAANDRLSPRQRRFLEALLTGVSVAQACRLTGTAERTAYRWLNRPDFKQALEQAEAELTQTAMRRLLTLQGEALEALQAILSDRTALPAQKLRAVEVVLNQSLKYRSAVELEARLAALEDAVKQLPNGGGE